jgi:hypothetical protein
LGGHKSESHGLKLPLDKNVRHCLKHSYSKKGWRKGSSGGMQGPEFNLQHHPKRLVLEQLSEGKEITLSTEFP